MSIILYNGADMLESGDFQNLRTLFLTFRYLCHDSTHQYSSKDKTEHLSRTVFSFVLVFNH